MNNTTPFPSPARFAPTGTGLYALFTAVMDVVAGVYGFKASRRAIVTTFALSVFAAGCFWVIIALPGAEW